MNSCEITCGLGTSIVGHQVKYFDTLDSTNNYARGLAERGCADGMTVIAAQQTSGKGRLGRKWESPAGKGIYMSIVLRPHVAPAQTQILTLAAAVAVVRAIQSTTGVAAGIKWPNDIIADGRKLCGILLETSCEAERVNYIILGIGINYSQEEKDFPEELREKAISLKTAALTNETLFDEAGRNVARRSEATICDAHGCGQVGIVSKLSLVRTLLRELDIAVHYILSDESSKILELWRKHSSTLGREVSFMVQGAEYKGVAADITTDGRLVVDCDDGVRRYLISGEVSVKGIYGS